MKKLLVAFCSVLLLSGVCHAQMVKRAESDPKVGAVTVNKWCMGSGTQVACDQNAPSASAAGNNTEVQVNSSGSLGSSSTFTYDVTNGLQVGGPSGAGALILKDSDASNTITTSAPSSVTSNKTCTLTDSAYPYTSCVDPSLQRRSKCVVKESVSGTDDHYPLGSISQASTVKNVWCTCKGTCTTKATFTLEDSAGNAMTITGTNPTCSDFGTTPTANAVTAGNTLTALESAAFNVTNTPTAGDTYELCYDYDITLQ